MAIDAAFWAGRRVLVTGHTGFKGSWLTLWLTRLGAEVSGLSLDVPTQPSLHDLARVDELVDAAVADVRDHDAVLAAVRRARPEIVVHMAAQSLVRRSFLDPHETYATNVMGTVNVLEAVRRTDGVRVVVNVTSDKCYENREWEWGYREDERMGGHDPYSSSKGAAELVTAAYRRSFFDGTATHVASARAGNVIGGGDWGEDRLLPDIVRATLAGEPARIRNPTAVRPWQHVLNPLSGYLLLAQALWEHEEFAQGWNFGPADEDARSVGWIVEQLDRRWPGGVRWAPADGEGPHEAHHLKLDSSRARARLGWRPGWGLDAALDAIVAWYGAYVASSDLREVTLEQIAAFPA